MTLAGSITGRLKKLVGDDNKRKIKVGLNSAKKVFVNTFRSYDSAALKEKLRKAGVAEGDTLMVHVNFEPHSGFQGTPLELVTAFAETVGENGNLLMVSIPFRGTAYDYLASNKTFNVQKTISMMGLVTEQFRRRSGTLRSLHPTHPVLAYGKDAAWLIQGHERCPYPCGEGTPFHKFREKGGKILFFDVSFGAITFYHYVEDVLKDRIPFAVYEERLFEVKAIDLKGETHFVKTYSFSRARTRNCEKLQAEMERRGRVRKGRIGNSSFILVTAEDVVSSFREMVDAGNYPYDS